MKILVTGGLGFIGSNLVKRLLQENNSITVLDNLKNSQKIENFDFLNKIKFINGDVRDASVVMDLTKDKDIVFHLAAFANVRESIKFPEYCFSTNVTGTLNVLKSSHVNKVKKVVFFSSREVYGNPKKIPVKETEPKDPINLYGLTKLISEDICEYFINKGLNVTIFRLANVYGEMDFVPGRVIPTFIKSALENKKLSLNGGQQTLDFVHVEDVIDNIILEMKSQVNSIINIGSGKEISVIELAKKIILLSESKSDYQINSASSQEVTRYCSDISMMRSKPKIIFDEGLKKLIQYYKNETKKE